MPDLNNSQAEFFRSAYTELRDGKTPFPWMERAFGKVCDGETPKVFSLPTASGKSDLVIIWLLALAFHGLGRGTGKPVPRRLVWVVNRRVLVNQTNRLAETLREKLASDSESPTLNDVKMGLANISGSPLTESPLAIVQLRGGIVHEREWSFHPHHPALIIGTVDQIGSRILFQGYGLGIRERPLHAGLFGVDSWICVDESHLVPAFCLLMRQLSVRITEKSGNSTLESLFKKLPWAYSELSATPGLPLPSNSEGILELSNEDRANRHLKPRLDAAEQKEIRLVHCTSKEIVQKLGSAAAALITKGKRVAIYVHKPNDVKKIRTVVEKALRAADPKIKTTDYVLSITGRVRGVDRDRLERNPVYQTFAVKEEDEKHDAAFEKLSTFLLGTSAAEVGVDSDADIILCDFADLSTLSQRLGRLDRVGRLFKKGITATMTIFGVPPQAEEKTAYTINHIVEKLAEERYQPSAQLLAGNAWLGEKKTDPSPEEIVSEATRMIISADTASSRWLKHQYAESSVYPVSCPPLTNSTLVHWTATSSRPDDRLPVHPWLYGFGNFENNTPLVGVIFRNELNATPTGYRSKINTEDGQIDESEEEFRRDLAKVFEIAPPERNEAHWIPLEVFRSWLSATLGTNGTPPAAPPPVTAFRPADGDWLVENASEIYAKKRSKIASQLRPDSLVIIGTLCPNALRMAKNQPAPSDLKIFAKNIAHEQKSHLPKLIASEISETSESRNDVAENVWPEGSPAKWKRTVAGTKNDKSSSLFETFSESGIRVTYHYERVSNFKENTTKQFLDTHHELVKELIGSQISALDPDSDQLSHFFKMLGEIHDAGKALQFWQHAIGNRTDRPLARPEKQVHSSRFKRFRHEFASLYDEKTEAARESACSGFPETERPFFSDLFNHLVASHHGHLRPSLPPQPNWQPSKLAPTIQKMAGRWLALQQQINPWKLAYLEGLLKAADTLGSRDGGNEA